MFLLEWTASDLLWMLLGAILFTGLVLWLVPGSPVPRRAVYPPSEITAYDVQLPQYLLAAALALAVGGLHMVVKNLPGFWLWLWEAGYGGHLFRDLSNSHIIIVGGGTVLLTALTWYLLPRALNRPLYSKGLATASFWFTILGVFGFYLSWLILGLVEGDMVRHGWDYMAAKEAIGAWHRVPTRLTASLMGVGYWTYVLNVFLTLGAARHLRPNSLGYLAKFMAVSAGALFVGTVQGVIQVLPANADWIHLAGKFGQYVDPISHAHINLVTGMVVSLAAFWAAFGTHLGVRPLPRRKANGLFWVLTLGSLWFYLTFLFLGLILGNAVNGYGGIHLPGLVPWLSRHRVLLLAMAGSAMLGAFWVYFWAIGQNLGGLVQIRQALWEATPLGFWIVSLLALLIGTFQGLLQVLPATAPWLTVAEEIPNIHAQLNMIGGVLLALIGTAYLLVPELLGRTVPRQQARLTLWGIGGGIFLYYGATLWTGWMRYRAMLEGASPVMAAERIHGWAPFVLMPTAAIVALGFGAFGRSIWLLTPSYRQAWVASWRRSPQVYTGPVPRRLQRIPPVYILGLELGLGLLGWPGAGWLFSGQALFGLLLLMGGPALAWAVLPLLFSPFTDTFLSPYGWQILLLWLPATSILSTLALAWHLHRIRLERNRTGPSSPNIMFPSPPSKTSGQNVLSASSGSPDLPPAVTSTFARTSVTPVSDSMAHGRQSLWRRVPLPIRIGTFLLLAVLLSVPLIPLFAGIPGQPSSQYLLMQLSPRANGAYIEMNDGHTEGFFKLYPWYFPLAEFPDNTPTLAHSYVRAIWISQKGLDDPARYRLFALSAAGHAREIPLQAEVVDFQRRMKLIPQNPLAGGRYMLDMPSGGMFAGREYYYFQLDPSLTVLPPLAEANAQEQLQQTPATQRPITHRASSTLLAGLAALISGTMAVIMWRRLRQRIRPHEVAWSVAFALFSLAAASQVAGDLIGWNIWLARLYYVSGATIVVGWLGLGTWLLLVKQPRWRQMGVWTMLLLTGYAVGLISLTPAVPDRLSQEGWHALQKPLSLTILTISLNMVGTLLLVGGALWSAWIFGRRGIQRERMIGCILLAVGALTVAAGGSLTRLGRPEYLYAAMCLGVLCMFWGYRKTIVPATSPDPSRPQSIPMISPHTGERLA